MPEMQKTIDHLNQLKAELLVRSHAIGEDIHHKKEPVEKDFAEQVTQRDNDDVLKAIDGETQQTIRLIDNALSRIKAGTYGTCATCGKQIAQARLDALPYVTTCIDCAEKA